MYRRDFLKTTLTSCMAGTVGWKGPSTVVLPGSIMVHSHVFVEYMDPADSPEDTDPYLRYEYDTILRKVRPKLEAVKALGCKRFLECTSPFFGRAPRLMRRLSEDIGLEIWICTGLRGTARHRYLPRYAFEESEQQLAIRWIKEIRTGIDGVRARFIKLGIDGGKNGAYGGRLAELDRKLLRAAVITTKETGVAIACHMGDSDHARITFHETLDLLLEERLPLDRFVVVHAQHEKDFALHEEMARAGCWVEFDGVPQMVDWTVEAVNALAEKDLLHRVLVSEDRLVCSAASLQRAMGTESPNYWPYTLIYTDFLPKLSPTRQRKLMISNPIAAFGD